jgi:hypothetical protein
MTTLKIDESWDLTRDEFADAIAKGLGRAFLYVRDRGLDRVKDLVLNACLHHVGYDPQCEGSRAKWLFLMFADSPYYLEFKDAILAALVVETETWDLLQLCQLAKEMALKGDIIAADRLADRVYQQAAQPSSNDWLGADELIEIRGIDAALELSRIFGRRLSIDPDNSVPDDLDLNFFHDMSEESIEIFDRHAKVEESIATYYNYIIISKLDRERNRAERSLQPQQRMTLEKIIDLARCKKHEYPFIYKRFGQKATTAELETVFSLLLNETDEDIYLRLLWIFRRAPMPRLAECLFEWADSDRNLIKTAALQALAQISDDRVHQLGRSKLADTQFNCLYADTLDLFINNYHSGDAESILGRLNAVEIDRADFHSIGLSIYDLSEKQSNPELAVLLEWIYDRTPCSICRKLIFGQLESYGLVSDELLTEYQFDSRKLE